jgi:predicted RNA binding protein YcfA (HicA-like mRNA interferase family)
VIPRLPSLSSRQIIDALNRVGFEYALRRGKGRHRAVVIRWGPTLLVIVPERKNIAVGTLRATTRQACLTPQAFLDSSR